MADEDREDYWASVAARLVAGPGEVYCFVHKFTLGCGCGPYMFPDLSRYLPRAHEFLGTAP